MSGDLTERSGEAVQRPAGDAAIHRAAFFLEGSARDEVLSLLKGTHA